MTLRGKGMLITYTEVAPADEADFNEWYNREHIDERVALPGFRRARRYAATKGDPKYFATYECGTVDDLADPGYLKLLAHQSPWSRRVMARFSKFHRLTLRIRLDSAHGVGGAVTAIRFVPDPGKRAALLTWLRETALPAAIAMPGMIGGFAGENDLEVANAPARAQGVKFPEASAVEWAVVLEGGDAKATAAACRKHFTTRALAPFGLGGPAAIGTYQLVYGNER